MNITNIDRNIHLVDLEVAGIEKSAASYVLTGKNTAIIETGPTSTVQKLLSSLEEMEVQPEEVVYVAVSHIHLDHAGAAGTLLKHLPQAELVVHRRGAPHMANPEKLWVQARKVLGTIADMYGKPDPVPKHRIIPANEGMNLNIGNGIRLSVIETLGHASHHLAYFEIQSQGIFVGDAAGVYLEKDDVVVPTTPSPYRLDIALSTLHKLANLKPTLLYYSHFGKAYNALDRLQAYENQLKLWAETAKEGIENDEDIETISKRIAQKDKALQKTVDYLRNHPIWSKTILHESVNGIKSFLAETGTILDGQDH